MRILVCGWLGSTNLGDELVFAGVRHLLGDAQVCAVSTDPAATQREHRIAAIDHRRLDLIAKAAHQADLVVFGGGGLIQDETSPFNLPYHLSRPWLAALRGTPWVGLALGVGPLDTPFGRVLATTLRKAEAVTVRDAPSLELLEGLGVPAELAADAAFHLQEAHPQVELEDVMAVSLRPWSGPGGLLPVGWRRSSEPDWFVPGVAAALDRAAAATGLTVRFVALQTDRDHVLHQRVAAAMQHPTELVVPERRTVLRELAAAQVVVAMRYHAGIGASLAGRPSVLIGYSPKVDALAQSLGEGAAHLPFDRAALEALDEAIVAQVSSDAAPAAVRSGVAALRERAGRNADMLARVIG